MNKFDSTPSRIRIGPTSEGWLVQVYGGDRRLLCDLMPGLFCGGLGSVYSWLWHGGISSVTVLLQPMNQATLPQHYRLRLSISQNTR